jgi:hypothetical protein
MAEEFKPIILDVPKPELKPLDETPLTKCELCLHYVRRVDKEHVFCMMYGETPHITASDYCEKFKPMEKDPVLAHIYRSLLDYETDEEIGVNNAINTAISVIEDELKEAGLCKELEITPDICSTGYTTCSAIVRCDNDVYRVYIAMKVKAKIDYAEREE